MDISPQPVQKVVVKILVIGTLVLLLCNNTGVGYGVAFDVDAANQTCIGRSATSDAANKVVIGNASVSAAHIQVDWTIDSDRRIKEDIEDGDVGLTFINKLQTRKFKKKHPSEWDAEIIDDRYKKGGPDYDE